MRVLRTASLVLALAVFGTSARAEPICGEGGEELEALVTRDAAKRAFEYLVYFPKGMADRNEPQTPNEKTKQASILFGNALLEHAYRQRVEWEVAKTPEAKRSYLQAQEQFCKFAGHGLMDLVQESK